jgi:uncharacterized membrane protein (UPF0127 family)
VFLLVVTLTLPAIAAGQAICGYAPKGLVTLSRDGQPVATFRVGLAENRAQYRQGLMHCTALEPGSGLLFVYPAPARRVFWMKDTPLGLAILFADADGRIQSIEEGKPYSTRRIHSPSDIQYVLEINFTEAGPLQIGDRITLRLVPE